MDGDLKHVLGFLYPGARRGSWARGPTRVDGRGLAYPDGLPEAGRGADAGWPTRVATMASTWIASLPWPKINIFKGHFRLFYGNH
ncbi:hypothetical protein DY000_02009938 [Brassica cretica]|uniref:Uncharacterized protein n=1 Tax=Brassica cretica TaxID=69181 RepID=A0ABQ7CEK4_BRACR|nr:hypothetical protein DY000_02009938 [Brassica cretica]